MTPFRQSFAIRIAAVTAIFAIFATFLVTLTELTTRDEIRHSQQQATLRALQTLIPAERYNNLILEDTLTLPPTAALHTTEPTTVYRARLDGEPVGAIFTVVAPNGYSGRITLLIGIYTDNTVAGVRVIQHQETPGLGDKIEAARHDWILQFNGLSLNNPPENHWRVKKEGGQFDQFTGATITPRAVITAIHNALQFFTQHQTLLFDEASS